MGGDKAGVEVNNSAEDAKSTEYSNAENHKTVEANEVVTRCDPLETSYTYKTPESQQKDQETPKEMSNYSQNITLSNASGHLSLNEINKSKQPILDDSKTVVRFSPIWKQTLAASASILITVTAGLTSGYSAILLPQLRSPDSNISGDQNTASWIASMAALPMALGCLISGWIMDKFGRRTSHLIICVPFLVGWILIACANELSLILAGRFLTGLCVGLLGPLGPVYIAETSEPRYRGFFLAGVSLAIAAGILIAHIIGTFLSWHWTAAICCLFPIASVLLLFVVPESPSWLISKGKLEEGVKSFNWLRGFDEDAKIELKGLVESQKTAESQSVISWKEKLNNFKSPELLKPLFIMILFFVTAQFSGINAVAFYSIEIMEKAVGKGIDHYLAMLIIDIVRVVMSVVACIICKKYGRRTLCFISGIWTAVSMIGLSVYLYFSDGKSTHLSWIPLSCLMIYICAVSIGLVPLPWIMCGEVFPTKVRGVGSGISSAAAFAAFFVVVKTAPGMMSNFGEVITFLIYGIVSLLGTSLMYYILPETKGKTLQEIEERFKSGRKY